MIKVYEDLVLAFVKKTDHYALFNLSHKESELKSFDIYLPLSFTTELNGAIVPDQKYFAEYKKMQDNLKEFLKTEEGDIFLYGLSIFSYSNKEISDRVNTMFNLTYLLYTDEKPSLSLDENSIIDLNSDLIYQILLVKRVDNRLFNDIIEKVKNNDRYIISQYNMLYDAVNRANDTYNILYGDKRYIGRRILDTIIENKNNIIKKFKPQFETRKLK